MNGNPQLRRRLPFVVAAMALLMTLAVHSSAYAGGKGGGASAGTTTLTLLNVDTPGQAPHWGQRITFQVQSTVTDRPFVELQCYQGGTRVLYASAGYFPDYPWPWSQIITLASSTWTSGAADCVARAFYSAGHNKFPTLTTLSFGVLA